MLSKSNGALTLNPSKPFPFLQKLQNSECAVLSSAQCCYLYCLEGSGCLAGGPSGPRVGVGPGAPRQSRGMGRLPLPPGISPATATDSQAPEA